MYVRLLYALMITLGVLVGTVDQQVLALVVAGVLVTRRALMIRMDRQPAHR